MGTEILSIFLLVPLLIGIIDLVKIARNKNRLKHIILISTAICLIGYMAMSSYLDGYNPMQGVVIGSLFYIPGYLILYCGLTTYFNKLDSSNKIT